jgi:phage tail sheath protein FI
MTTNYTTPGVYIQEVPNLPPAVAQVETAIPAFIGYTATATQITTNDLKFVPTRIESFVEYQKIFGDAQTETSAVSVKIINNADGSTTATASLDESARSPHYMYYAVQLFYANGGGPCYIVSTGVYTTISVTDLESGLTAAGKEDEPTLLVFPEAQKLDIGDFLSLHDAALKQCALLQDRFVIMDVTGGIGTGLNMNDSATSISTIMTNFRSHATPSDNLMYGAAYGPNIETTLGFPYDETTTSVKVDTATAVMMSTLPATNLQTYNQAKAAINAMTLDLPPAGAVAGIYAAVDNARGVWKAPANVTVSTAVGPTIAISAADQGGMNVDATSGKSVNAIRAFAGLGTLVWGARTLDGNDNEWRYVNVRRFCIMVEESIKKATMQFVFEPNDANTWVKVQGMIENFLTTQWRQGALQGVKPEDAFYVSVGLGKTMTADDVLNGRMIVQVGLCPVRPAEFIVLQFIQTLPVS